MERAEPPHQIHGVNSSYNAPRKCLGDSVERHAIVRIIKSRYKNGAISYVEVRVARGQALAIHRHRAGKRNRHYSERLCFRRRLEATEIVHRPRVILIRWIRFVRQNHSVTRAEPRDVVDVTVGVVANSALAQPYSIGDAEI